MASANMRDAVNEMVIVKGMDCTPAVERGFINWDHKEGPINIIGYPKSLELVYAEDVPAMKSRGIEGLTLWAKGELWRPGVHDGADDAWKLAKAVQGTPRQLAWSIQGRVLDRTPDGRITKSILTQLALTHQPILQSSFADVAKSFGSAQTTAGVMTTGSFNANLLENLDGKLTKTLYGDCSKSHYDNKGCFTKGRRSALEHLTQCHGHDMQEAKDYLAAIIRSGIGR